tara:strand:- start:189 stop:404 length:216 start_codon:yes stop_codon:yes gene_type:complete
MQGEVQQVGTLVLLLGLCLTLMEEMMVAEDKDVALHLPLMQQQELPIKAVEVVVGLVLIAHLRQKWLVDQV